MISKQRKMRGHKSGQSCNLCDRSCFSFFLSTIKVKHSWYSQQTFVSQDVKVFFCNSTQLLTLTKSHPRFTVSDQT